jgi:hypothetical protein
MEQEGKGTRGTMSCFLSRRKIILRAQMGNKPLGPFEERIHVEFEDMDICLVKNTPEFP